MNFMKSVLFGDQGVYKVFGHEVQFKESEEHPNRNETIISKILNRVFQRTSGYSHVLVHELGHAGAYKLLFGSDSKIAVFTQGGGATRFNIPKGCKEGEVPFFKSDYQKFQDKIDQILLKDRNQDNCLEFIKQSGICLASIPQENRTKALCEAAVEESPHALLYVPDHLKTADMCTDAVKRFSEVIMYVPERFLTFDMALSAVQRNYHLVGHIDDKFKTQEFFEKTLFTNPLLLNPLLSSIDNTDHIKIIKNLVSDKVFEQLKENGEKNKWKDAFILYAGPMANLAYSGCKIVAAAALKDYIGLPLSLVFGAGGALGIDHEIRYAYSSMMNNDTGDFGRIRQLGPKFLMAATAAFATQCAMTALGTLYFMS